MLKERESVDASGLERPRTQDKGAHCQRRRDIDEQTALTHIVLEYVLSIDPEEVEDAITDGSHDRGIDAVYVDSRDGQNTIHIFQLKYVTTFDKAKKNFPSGEIDKLILQLVTDPQDQAVIREGVFDDNVRVYLKRKNQINRKIIASALSSRNSDFWYLNNGITMTCDSFSYQAGRRAPVVSLKSVQIVNGGQTSHALFEARQDDPDAIRRVLVLVRIYETKTKEISTRIAESTNSQTPINTRDLRSNDDVQKTLEEGFLDLGLYYERKAKQYADRPKQKRVDALAAGQAYLAYILGKPEVAKKDRARVFGDLYDEIFNDDITPQKLSVPLRVLAVVESEKREIQRRIRRQESIDPQQLYLVDGAYHVLYAVAFLINLRQKDLLDEKMAKLLIETAKQGVAKTVQQEEKADPAFTFNRFFKDPRTRLKIDETLLSLNLLESKSPGKRTRPRRRVASRKKK